MGRTRNLEVGLIRAIRGLRYPTVPEVGIFDGMGKSEVLGSHHHGNDVRRWERKNMGYDDRR